LRPLVLKQFPPPRPGWSADVKTWDVLSAPGAKRSGRKPNPYLLTHAHLHAWSSIVANPTSRATAFVHIEDDLCLSARELATWAHDTALLEGAGASGAGFLRGFYRFEVTKAGREMHWQRVKDLKTATAATTKYKPEFINARAATWRAAHNVSLGERFVLDERLHRRFMSPLCDGPPCFTDTPLLDPGRISWLARSRFGTNSTTSLGAVSVGEAANPTDAMTDAGMASSSVRNASGVGSWWCSNYPTLVVHRPALPPRAFIALANPYSAITAAPRSLVADFLLRSRGWNSTTEGGRSYRTRHKAYGVREYGSSTFDYAHEFVRFRSAGSWPSGQLDDVLKVSKGHRGGMRRVLVPLMHDPSMPRSQRWRLDTFAGVHHMSDRVVNGPRKGWVESTSARYREHEVVRCTEPKPSRTPK